MTNREANLAELVGINEQAAVEDERRLRHVVVDGLPVDLAELLPLGRNHDGFLLLARLKRRRREGDLLLDCRKKRPVSHLRGQGAGEDVKTYSARGSW